MKKIETQIVIEASRAAVWARLMDFNAYTDWNPFLISVAGEASEGAILNNLIRLKKGKEMAFQPVVLVVKPEREFRWKGKTMISGLFDGEHYFQLTENSDGNTLLVHGEQFSGLLTTVIMSMIEKDTLRGFVAMNEALKGLVETNGEEAGHVS